MADFLDTANYIALFCVLILICCSFYIRFAKIIECNKFLKPSCKLDKTNKLKKDYDDLLLYHCFPKSCADELRKSNDDFNQLTPFKHDATREWSDDAIMFPMSDLSGYINSQGMQFLSEEPEILQEWNKINSDASFWTYHCETSRNLQKFLHLKVQPNMERRCQLLNFADPEKDNNEIQNLIRLIQCVLSTISSRYVSNGDKINWDFPSVLGIKRYGNVKKSKVINGSEVVDKQEVVEKSEEPKKEKESDKSEESDKPQEIEKIYPTEESMEMSRNAPMIGIS